MLTEPQKREVTRIATENINVQASRVTFHGDRISVEYPHNKWRDDYSLQQFMTAAHGGKVDGWRRSAN